MLLYHRFLRYFQLPALKCIDSLDSPTTATGPQAENRGVSATVRKGRTGLAYCKGPFSSSREASEHKHELIHRASVGVASMISLSLCSPEKPVAAEWVYVSRVRHSRRQLLQRGRRCRHILLIEEWRIGQKWASIVWIGHCWRRTRRLGQVFYGRSFVFSAWLWCWHIGL